jgi:hypothetical protein
VAGFVSILILIIPVSEPPNASLATIPVPAFSGPFYSLKAAEERGGRKNTRVCSEVNSESTTWFNPVSILALIEKFGHRRLQNKTL